MSNKSLEIVNSQRALRKLSWLTPPDSLKTFSGGDFGRNIEASIKTISTTHKPCLINIRKRSAAVVIGVHEYEEMLNMKDLYARLLEQFTREVVAEAGDEFDQLFARIENPKSHAASDALFSAGGADLASTFKPGRTESR